MKEIANNGSIVIYVYGPLLHRQIENAFYKKFLPLSFLFKRFYGLYMFDFSMLKNF